MFILQLLLLNSSINSLPPPEFLEDGAIPNSLITTCAFDLKTLRNKKKKIKKEIMRF
jgi:hypothetical protein